MSLPSRKSIDSKPPLSPTRSTVTAGSPGSPSSPPRKVVTDFAAFGAPTNASVFGTKVAQTPFSLAGGKAAFGGMRGGGRGMFDADEEEEEEEDGRQKVELREGSISLEQVSAPESSLDPELKLVLFRPDELQCRVHGDPRVPDICPGNFVFNMWIPVADCIYKPICPRL